MMDNDWRYDDQRLKIREQALRVLMSKFSNVMINHVPKYSSQSIYECAHDWVSQGNTSTSGIVKYYEAYYAKSN